MPEIYLSKNGHFHFRSVFFKKITIGRSADNDLILPDDSVSRFHAEIIEEDGGFVLVDHSSVGTHLDGECVSRATLVDGQKITIGPWQLSFKLKAEEEIDRERDLATCITRIQKDSSPTKILKLDLQTGNFLVEKAFLSMTSADGKSHVHELKGSKTLLGSRSDCDVVIGDDYVSGHHAEITSDQGVYFLKDLNSTNGTFYQEGRIQELRLISSTAFSLGKTRFVFETGEAEEKILPSKESKFCGLVGQSSLMRALYKKIERVAPSSLTILIQGESGTGKELVARALHDLSSQKNGPYVALNCGAISSNLIESELFGHEKGAFTGADRRFLGAFEQAQNGSLFLDEIGELPLELQPKLLRVLESQTIRRVGGNVEIQVDVRILAATHRDLPLLVKEGLFREDLFYRLYMLPLLIPSLRERKEDIALLATYFLRQASHGAQKKISPGALQKLTHSLWPGNVRELKNTVLRSLVFSEGEIIQEQEMDVPLFPEPEMRGRNGISSRLAQTERETIEEILKKTAGNKTKAAELLGIAKSTLFKKLKEYGMNG